jgi:hypothetical protein
MSSLNKTSVEGYSPKYNQVAAIPTMLYEHKYRKMRKRDMEKLQTAEM